MSPQEIHEDMVQKLRGDSPSYATAKHWSAKFNRGRISVKDEAQSGRPRISTCVEIVQKIYDVVLAERRVSMRHIASTVGISQERVHSVLTHYL